MRLVRLIEHTIYRSLYVNKGAESQRDANLRERIARWRDAFRDDTTGIHKTLDDLVWNYAAFRTAIQIVRLRTEKRHSEPPINQMLFDLISEGYWSSLLLGIRRILDVSAAINGRRGVYSLRSVIKDIEACRTLINRRVYVEWIREAQYDLDLLRKEQRERLVAQAGKPIWGNPELPKSESSHRHFDFLSGVSETNRSPYDLIDPTVLSKVQDRLVTLNAVTDYVDSHLAHAGNRESRHGKALDNFDIRKARDALKELKQIADLVGIWFANESGSGLATFLGDPFEGLDASLVASADIKYLETQWREIDRDVASWSITAEQL
jgi:hypothetical protein